jgi:hypothetical protein
MIVLSLSLPREGCGFPRVARVGHWLVSIQ